MTCGGLFAAEIRSMSMTWSARGCYSVASDLYAADRFSYKIPIAQAFASSRFFMAVCPFIGCARMSCKKRFTPDGCHDIRSELRGAPARAARAASSRPDDHVRTDDRRDRASVPARAGPAAERKSK